MAYEGKFTYKARNEDVIRVPEIGRYTYIDDCLGTVSFIRGFMWLLVDFHRAENSAWTMNALWLSGYWSKGRNGGSAHKKLMDYYVMMVIWVAWGGFRDKLDSECIG
jgi:hypothetical protein